MLFINLLLFFRAPGARINNKPLQIFSCYDCSDTSRLLNPQISQIMPDYIVSADLLDYKILQRLKT